MTAQLQRDLESAIQGLMSLEEIVALLRRYKEQGVTQPEVYALLESLRDQAPNEAVEDRILEVADFVAGFCSPQMKIWES